MQQCAHCRKIVLDNRIKMLPKQIFEPVCDICRGEKKVDIKPKKKLVIENVDETSNKKIMYFCERCNYKFRHNPSGSVRLYCPWCGSGDKSSVIK